MRNQDEFNLFKEYFKSRLNLEMWKFETLGRTKYFSTENTLKVLDNEIYRMSNILDSGWPFTSYHFDSSVFDEDNFFEGEYIHNFLCDYQKFIAECNESSEIMTSIETTYTRAKWLEFLIQEKNRLLQPKSTETNHSVSQ